ncbi:MAG: shikimate kinase [Phycisphaerales bacterium]
MTNTKPNLILIGLRASGKSTIGAKLALELQLPFVDLDNATAQHLNEPSTGTAIANHGMEAFRAGEFQTLQAQLIKTTQVLALGGGTPTAPGCSELLSSAQASGSSRIFYLKATPATLQQRLQHTDNSSRPSLTGADLIDEVQTVFDARDPLYAELAESTIHVDNMTEDSLLVALLALIHAGI